MYWMLSRELHFTLVNRQPLRKTFFTVIGAKEIVVELVKSAYVPANINFERTMKIIRGFHKDGLYTELNIPNKHDLSIIVTIAELTNLNAIG